jgi:hypothetical protein|tara:strand:- start:6653 stop:6904 length:252 start_codon:yes stop_codon:yes gene_type:complete
MPSQPSLDIVNALFAGQKDLSDYVNTQMQTLALDKLDGMKQEVGAAMFAAPEEGPENTEQPEDAVPPDQTEEEPTDETDNGEN